MAKRTGNYRRKTRHKMHKPLREKGKISIRRYLQTFKQGDKVVLKAEPAIQTGLYMVRRYHGMVGTVEAKRGACYEVSIFDRNKEKTMLVHPVHLKAHQKTQLKKE